MHEGCSTTFIPPPPLPDFSSFNALSRISIVFPAKFRLSANHEEKNKSEGESVGASDVPHIHRAKIIVAGSELSSVTASSCRQLVDVLAGYKASTGTLTSTSVFQILLTGTCTLPDPLTPWGAVRGPSRTLRAHYAPCTVIQPHLVRHHHFAVAGQQIVTEKSTSDVSIHLIPPHLAPSTLYTPQQTTA